MKNVVIVDSVETGPSQITLKAFNMTRKGDDMLAHCIDAILGSKPFS